VVVKLLLKLELLALTDLAEAAARVNHRLCQNNESGLFVTLWFGVYSPQTGIIDYVNAGHNPPLVRSGSEGFRYLANDPPCLVMGMLDDEVYQSGRVLLQKNDILFLYTDGLTEAENDRDEQFGEERLQAVLNQQSGNDLQKILREVKMSIAAFVGERPQSDDQTCLMVVQTAETGNRIVLPADRAAFPRVMDYINAVMDSLGGCDPGTRTAMLTAAEELFINIADYAYHGGAGELIISTVQDGERVSVTFADQGVAFNPLDVPPPDLTIPLEVRTEGGFGIFLVKQMMDVVEYCREAGWNRLTIGKTVALDAGQGV
jgi:sigma-B regulation protein RsbU (phosphoserine phosphatase)